ncbi:MAG: hypothetical protein ACKV2T_17815 [Kofleriaceae bacterium]
MTKRGSKRDAADAGAKEIVLRVDGGGWHPSTADPGAILTLAAAYVEGLRAVAKASELQFTLKGVTIRDECVAIGIGVDRVAPAIEAAKELSTALLTRASLQGTSMVVERIRAALQSLPPNVSATIKVGKRWQRKLEPDAGPALSEPVGELTTLRARPIRAGGVTPAVRFSAEGEREFTLPCTEELSRELGAHLYREVEIEASIIRTADGHIEDGQLIGFAVVNTDEEPAEAWERWFKINGSGWNDESVEAFIGRRED